MSIPSILGLIYNILRIGRQILSKLDDFIRNRNIKKRYGENHDNVENGDIDNSESVVWYNRDKIKQGKLQDCYNKSYWRPAFEKLLQNDVELSHLEKNLKKEY